MGRYIVDFVCLRAGLVVELDGGQHGEQLAYDEARTRQLKSMGYTVVRYWDHEVLLEPESVFKDVRRRLQSHPSPLPSPRKRGEGDLR